MRILFIHTFYTLKGGEDAVFENDLAEMAKKGHEVEALIFSNEKFGVVKLLSLPFNISSYFQTSERIRTFKPDLVHIHNLHFAASPSVIRAVKAHKVRCVMTLHNFRLVCPSATLYHREKLYLSSLKEGFPWKAIRDGVYRNSVLMTFWLSFSNWINKIAGTWNIVDHFIVPNAYAKKLFEESAPKLFANKVTVKPNYSEAVGITAGSARDGFLFVGRLSEEKGLLTLLKSHKEQPFRLSIVGDGPLRQVVEDHARNHTLLTYHGFMNKEEILRKMRSSKALILCSVCMEMNPLTMIEAMASATAIITSDLPTLTEFITDGYNGLHFQTNNAASLSETVRKFDALPEAEVRRMGLNGRKIFETKFTRESHDAAMSAIYANFRALPQLS